MAAGVVPCGGRKNVSPYIIIVQIIFSGPLDSLISFRLMFGIEFRLAVLGGGVAHFITGLEQSQLNRIYFPS